MAAKGYHEAFKAVMTSLRKILRGQPSPEIVYRDLAAWYRALSSPSVQAGLLPAHALAGYRNRPVFIRGSEHVPPPYEAVPELLDMLFALLAVEPSAGVQAVLGRFARAEGDELLSNYFTIGLAPFGPAGAFRTD